jgi:CubicO group peptidase (beta-lactamase class C family)
MLAGSGFLSWGVACCLAAVIPPQGAKVDRSAVDAIIKPFLKDKDYLALVVGVTRPEGRQIYAYGKYTLDGKTHAPAADTVFEIGSITKVFTGTLLADLVSAGKVRLDDPAQKYLPPDLKLPRRDDRDISLLHLATHSSSLPVQPPNIGIFALAHKSMKNPYSQYRLAELAKSLESIKLAKPIGCEVRYSNLGVGLLGHALAGADKAASYEDALTRHVTRPLGMNDTSIYLSDSQRQRFPPCHDQKGAETPPWDFACLEACGGLRSTTQDLLLFVEANLGRRQTPLERAFRLAHETWRDRGPPNDYVGLCWMHDPLKQSKGTMTWHNGGTFGSRSFLGFVPGKNVGVVILSNSSHPVDDQGFALLEKLAKDQ